MRTLFTNLVLFLVLAIAFSGLTACSGTQVSNGNTAKAPVNAGQEVPANKSSAYPPLPSGIADMDIELLDGTKSKVTEHKGKVLILNLWGIWCGPCREEMPHLAAMQRQYADKGLEVISLNIGDQDQNPEPVENIKKFAEQMKIDYTLARITRDGTQQFYLISKQQVVPQTLLVDREGHLRGVFVGGGQKIFDSLQQSLDKLMAE